MWDCVKWRLWSLRGGVVVDRDYCSPRGSRFNSRHIHSGGSQSSTTPIPRYVYPMPFSDLCGHKACMWYTDCTRRQNTCAYKNQYITFGNGGCEMSINIHPLLLPEFGCNGCSYLLLMLPKLEALSALFIPSHDAFPAVMVRILKHDSNKTLPL